MKLLNVSKTYYNKNNTVTALKDINLSFEDQGITFIIGSSGCGKTTLLNIMSGQDQDYEGKVICDGHVEVIEQDIYLFEAMSVYDNLWLICNDKEKINSLLERFDLVEYANQKVKLLSIGQKKRVQIIRALLLETQYLLCDEPTAALDHENGQQVMNTLKEISKEVGVIVVTHEIALVDQYASRVIKMDQGIIESDSHQIDNINEIPVKSKISKQSFKQHFFLATKGSLARPFELIVKLLLIFTTVFTVFVATSLFTSFSNAVDNKNIWRTSQNIIITEPNEGNDELDVDGKFIDENFEGYYFYDLYDKADIQLVKDNVEGILGYQCGLNSNRFSMLYGSYFDAKTIDEVKKLVEDGQKKYDETGQIPFEDFVFYKNQLGYYMANYPDGNWPKGRIITSDVYYKVFFDEQGISSNLPGHGVTNTIYISDLMDFEVIPYQLFDCTKMELKEGKHPVNDNEIIINDDVAQRLKTYYSLSDISELIGYECPLNFLFESETLTNIIITGISYNDNNNENQIFFRDGAFNQIVNEFYNIDSDKIKYQFLNFIVDDGVDSQKVVKELDSILESKESHFVLYNESNMVEQSEYQNPLYFYLFVGALFVGIIIIYILIQGIHKQRTIKEMIIQRRYGYNSLIIIVIETAIMMMIGGVIQMLSLTYLCNWLNQLANSLNYAIAIDYNYFVYLFSFVIAVIVVMAIEGGLYALRTKKYQQEL